MADNVTLPAQGSGSTTPIVAADEVTYSGDTAKVQLMRMVVVSGSEGSKTLSEISDSTNGIDVDVTRSALPTGASTETTLGTRLSESDFDTKVGSLTESAPASDTASSGLNGRLQRIAQRITSLIALLPTALTGSGNFKVAVQESLPAGTNAIGKLSANSGVDIGDVDVTSIPGIAGDVAHDGTNSGNPVQVGVEAIAHGTNPTAVASGDRTKLYANRAGIQFVIGGHPNIQTFRLRWTSTQTDVSLVGTINSGTKVVLTSITVTVDEATTVGVGVRVGFAATNTPSNSATSGVVLDHDGLVPGGGLTRGDGSGILGIGADGEELRITAEAPTSGSAIIYGTYYTIES